MVLHNTRAVVRPADHVATCDRQVVGEQNSDCCAWYRFSNWPISRVNTRDGARQPTRQDHNFIAYAQNPTSNGAGVSAVVVVFGCTRANDVLHRKAHIDAIVIARGVHIFKMMQKRWSFKPAEVWSAINNVVAFQCANWQEGDVVQVEPCGKVFKVFTNFFETLFAVVNKVHLVHTHHKVRNTE